MPAGPAIATTAPRLPVAASSPSSIAISSRSRSSNPISVALGALTGKTFG
jgi:hypothetical protein